MNLDLAVYIGEKIKYFRKTHNWTQSQLGEKVGLAKSTVANYEKGFRTPQQDKLFDIADVLGISVSDLFPETRNNQTMIIDSINETLKLLDDERKESVYVYAKEQLEEQKNVLKFPDKVNEEPKSIIYGRKSAAGYAIEVDDNDADVKPESLVPKGANERVEITGDSMEPLIKKGSDVYIRHQPTIENGEVAIVRIENEGVTCKRVYTDLENRTVTLKSENKKYEDMHFDPSQITILGKVLL